MKTKYKIGIIGVGMVGGAMQRYLEKSGVKPYLFDKFKNLGSIQDLNKADVIFVAVPTPYDEEKGGFDLSCIIDAFRMIESGKIVIIKSTVLPGTTNYFQKKRPDLKLLFNPEFLTELTADQDMSYPDRQIVGYTDKSYTVAGDIMQILPLAPFERVVPVVEAELIKYYGNTWFSVKVSFANQMYDLCQKLGVDYDSVKECAAADKRIGRTHLDIFHKGYRGYGGKCLPKDTKALIQLADKVGVNLRIHKAAEEVNMKLMEEQKIKNPEKFSVREG